MQLYEQATRGEISNLIKAKHTHRGTSIMSLHTLKVFAKWENNIHRAAEDTWYALLLVWKWGLWLNGKTESSDNCWSEVKQRITEDFYLSKQHQVHIIVTIDVFWFVMFGREMTSIMLLFESDVALHVVWTLWFVMSVFFHFIPNDYLCTRYSMLVSKTKDSLFQMSFYKR